VRCKNAENVAIYSQFMWSECLFLSPLSFFLSSFSIFMKVSNNQ
jgi:hypothetical protein